MPTFGEGQVIPLADTNAYTICDGGKKYALTVRMSDSILYKVWFSREADDAAGSLRAKSNFSDDYVSVPVESSTLIPGIPVYVTTTGDMIDGTMVFTSSPPEPAPVA